ncbi:MAG: FRG domain-containing protein [Deltaproteobacteria bacterium]|jgi:FRG domain|nr:FRG domain-containing protein [Deltaproteobacteria bacterium]
MILFNPKIKSTIHDFGAREWIPSSLDNLLKEIENISIASSKNDSLILYRGQANNDWPLDSTFVRMGIKALFGINNYVALPKSIRHRVSFHRAIASLFLMKFDKIIKPSEEAFEKESSHGIDPYFELLKNVQQYPENYSEVPFITGTNLIDWTNNLDIALYFATFTGRENLKTITDEHGAVWVFNASSTGKILQTDKMEKTIELMASANFLDGNKSLPLMFHPQKQTNQQRASNQKPVYIAQMDFRYDLADVWACYDKKQDNNTFVKIHIKDTIKHDIAKYLKSKDVSEKHVFPH